MKKIYFVTGLLILIASRSFAQGGGDLYLWSIGPRVAYTYGIDFKYFFDDNKTIGATASHEFEDSQVYRLSLHVQYQDLFTHDRAVKRIPIYWFAGPGIRASYYKPGLFPGNTIDHTNTSGVTSFGIEAALGIEYLFKKMPLVIGFDVCPAVEFVNSSPETFDSGIFLRYAFY